MVGIHREEHYATNLAERVKNGELIEITEFKLEFGWLSNFYWHYGMLYTVEHEFQAAKAAGSDQVLAERIIDASTPAQAKRLGRKAQLPRDWDKDKDLVMKRALIHKFSLSPMKEWLIATGDIPLAEGNFWHDNYWGSCGCSECKSVPGNNRLGILLMEIRSELRERETRIHQERIDQARQLRKGVKHEV